MPRFSYRARDQALHVIEGTVEAESEAAAIGQLGNAGVFPIAISEVGSTGSQRSSKWYIQGVPYDMVEIDLTEFDDQVQQAGIQSYPYFWAKDFAPYNPAIEVTVNPAP